jgi:hypothetical protein
MGSISHTCPSVLPRDRILRRASQGDRELRHLIHLEFLIYRSRTLRRSARIKVVPMARAIDQQRLTLRHCAFDEKGIAVYAWKSWDKRGVLLA